jgi:hypothetical protein
MTATVHYLHWAAEAHGVLDAAEGLLAEGDATDVIAFCELAVSYLEANASDIGDPAPLVPLARRLGDLHRRAMGGVPAARAGGPASRHPAARRPLDR